MKFSAAMAVFIAFSVAPSVVALPALAQQPYPSKPIRLLVGFPPGGATDVTARLVAPRVADSLRQQIVVDNRGGAHGNIASELVARAEPDGHTLLLGTISMLAINPGLYKKLPFDPVGDFAPITILVSLSNVVVIHPSVAANSINDLIALAKAKPGFLSYATSGAGSPGHLAGEVLKTLARIDMTHIPYKGGAPAINDLLGGQVHIMIATVPTAVPHVKSGRVKALAVTTKKRSVGLPDVPTIAEATGFASYEANNWYGVLAPARTPRHIVDKLNTEFISALKQPDVREKLLVQGLEPTYTTPEEFSAYLKAEIVKWSRVARNAGAKVE